MLRLHPQTDLGAGIPFARSSLRHEARRCLKTHNFVACGGLKNLLPSPFLSFTSLLLLPLPSSSTPLGPLPPPLHISTTPRPRKPQSAHTTNHNRTLKSGPRPVPKSGAVPCSKSGPRSGPRNSCAKKWSQPFLTTWGRGGLRCGEPNQEKLEKWGRHFLLGDHNGPHFSSFF